MDKFKPKKLAATKPTKTAATPRNNGFEGKKAVSEVIQGKSDLNPANNQPVNAMANSIMSGINQLEAERKSNNAFCVQVINQLLQDRDTLNSIRKAVSQDAANPAAKYAVGIQSLLSEFDAGELYQIGKRCEAIAKTNDHLGRQFLSEKVKPLICSMNVLIDLENKTYRWATYEELKAQLPAQAPTESTNTFLKLVPLNTLRTMQQQRRINKARKDPYCSVTKDGVIKYHAKPFTGSMSEADKKLLRDKEHAEAEAKIRAEIEKTTKRKISAEMMDAEKAVQQKELEIIAEARLKAAHIHSKQIVRNTKLASFKPVAVAMVVGVIAFTIAINTPEDQEQEIQTAAFDMPYTDYQELSND